MTDLVDTRNNLVDCRNNLVGCRNNLVDCHNNNLDLAVLVVRLPCFYFFNASRSNEYCSMYFTIHFNKHATSQRSKIQTEEREEHF
jgi:hypothetical protein